MTTFFKKMEAIKNESEERTYGHFPSARDIKKAQRQEEVARERECLSRLHRVTSPTETQPSARCPSPVRRPPTQARQALASSMPRQHGMRMPTSARPAYNRASGGDLLGEYNPRLLERSKTDYGSLQPRREDPDFMTYSTDSRPEQTPEDKKTPFFLSELQLPKLENRKAMFRNTVAIRPRHHFIHPDWISEGMVIKRLRMEHRSNPLLYGWI